MRSNLTQAIEDYLKEIYELTRHGKRATTNQIADNLGITPASVTGMLKKLAETDPPLIEYQKHHGVTLTTEGEKVALQVLRTHRLIEMFLYQVLGYDWDEVHAEADRLEHVISREFEDRIAETLGHPERDPHGDPIPDQKLQIPATSFTRLYDLQPGQEAVVHRVRDTNPDLLRHLQHLGIVPQARVRAVAYSPLDENLTLEVAGQGERVVLGPRVTLQVYVEVVSGSETG